MLLNKVADTAGPPSGHEVNCLLLKHHIQWCAGKFSLEEELMSCAVE